MEVPAETVMWDEELEIETIDRVKKEKLSLFILHSSNDRMPTRGLRLKIEHASDEALDQTLAAACQDIHFFPPLGVRECPVQLPLGSLKRWDELCAGVVYWGAEVGGTLLVVCHPLPQGHVAFRAGAQLPQIRQGSHARQMTVQQLCTWTRSLAATSAAQLAHGHCSEDFPEATAISLEDLKVDGETATCELKMRGPLEFGSFQRFCNQVPQAAHLSRPSTMLRLVVGVHDGTGAKVGAACSSRSDTDIVETCKRYQRAMQSAFWYVRPPASHVRARYAEVVDLHVDRVKCYVKGEVKDVKKLMETIGIHNEVIVYTDNEKNVYVGVNKELSGGLSSIPEGARPRPRYLIEVSVQLDVPTRYLAGELPPSAFGLKFLPLWLRISSLDDLRRCVDDSRLKCVLHGVQSALVHGLTGGWVAPASLLEDSNELVYQPTYFVVDIRKWNEEVQQQWSIARRLQASRAFLLVPEDQDARSLWRIIESHGIHGAFCRVAPPRLPQARAQGDVRAIPVPKRVRSEDAVAWFGGESGCSLALVAAGFVAHSPASQDLYQRVNANHRLPGVHRVSVLKSFVGSGLTALLHVVAFQLRDVLPDDAGIIIYRRGESPQPDVSKYADKVLVVMADDCEWVAPAGVPCSSLVIVSSYFKWYPGATEYVILDPFLDQKEYSRVCRQLSRAFHEEGDDVRGKVLEDLAERSPPERQDRHVWFIGLVVFSGKYQPLTRCVEQLRDRVAALDRVDSARIHALALLSAYSGSTRYLPAKLFEAIEQHSLRECFVVRNSQGFRFIHCLLARRLYHDLTLEQLLAQWEKCAGAAFSVLPSLKRALFIDRRHGQQFSPFFLWARALWNAPNIWNRKRERLQNQRPRFDQATFIMELQNLEDVKPPQTRWKTEVDFIVKFFDSAKTLEESAESAGHWMLAKSRALMKTDALKDALGLAQSAYDWMENHSHANTYLAKNNLAQAHGLCGNHEMCNRLFRDLSGSGQDVNAQAYKLLHRTKFAKYWKLESEPEEDVKADLPSHFYMLRDLYL